MKKEIYNKIASDRQQKPFGKIALCIALCLFLTAIPVGASQWWDSSRNFRLPVTINSAGFERIDKPIEVNVDFTQLLNNIGKTGSFDDNSLHIIEIDSTGNILNNDVKFQFDKDPDYNADTKASGNIIFIMDGITQANKIRYYHVYFNLTGGIFTPFTMNPLVSITDNVMDEGQNSYKIDAVNSTYYFQKDAGGFSSWIDKNGKDWIGYSTAIGTSGVYRGIPNAVYAKGIFHPGFSCCSSIIVSQGPIKIRIKSVSNDGEWESIWDIYPKYAEMTMTKANSSYGYWMLYEGTPGGTLEPNIDFMVKSNGIKNLLSNSWSGDIVNNEWVYFSDPNIGNGGESLFVTHREDDTLNDFYKILELPIGADPITVFGFGRVESPQVLGLLSYVPQHFAIGLIEGTDYAQNSIIINSAYKDYVITKNSVEQNNTNGNNNTNDVQITFDNSHNRQPVWSPDSQWIAFSSDRSGDWDIWKTSINGESAGLKQLTSYGGFDLEPSWFPNNRILYARGSGQGFEDVYVMNDDGTNIVRLTNQTDFDEYADWSPDGTKIVYTSVGGNPGGAKQIWIMNTDGTNKHKINNEYGIQPAWSPDGTRIAFKCFKGGANICLMNVDGTNLKQLTFETGPDTHDPDWSPDSNKIVYASKKDGDFEIYVMDADGSNKTQLTTNVGIDDNYPRWSPDGQNIIFASNRSGHEEIWEKAINFDIASPDLKINSFSPLSDPITIVGTEQVFSISLNKKADITWSIDGNDIFSEANVKSSSITNSTTGVGTHTVNVVANDGKDIKSKQWTWTINDIVPTNPTVIDNSPKGDNIPVDSQITVTFSQDMDKQSVESNFSISPTISGSGSFSWNQNIVTFIPNEVLTHSTTYTVTVGTGAKDKDGNSLQSAFVWSFTTLPLADLGPKIPPTPIITNVTTGNFWVKYIIQAGNGDNITDSFYVNANGVWNNGTTSNEINITVSPHGNGHIDVFAFNNTGALSLTSATQDTQIPNNIPIQNSIGDKNVVIGNELTFAISSTDPDGDPITYSTNATKGNLATSGIYSWTPDIANVGKYIWEFCSEDNFQGKTCEAINVTVGNVTVGNESALIVNITEPRENDNVNFIDNIVRGDIISNVNINNVSLNIINHADINQKRIYNLTITANKFMQRVEYFPNQKNVLELIATDNTGNSSKVSRTVTVSDNNVQDTTNVNAGEPITIDAKKEAGTEIIFVSNITQTATFRITGITNGTEIGKLNSNISSGERSLGYLSEIDIDGINATNESEVQNATIKLFYNKKDLDLNGDGTIDIEELDENKISFYWFDPDSNIWKKVSNGNPQWIMDSGIVKVSSNDPGNVWLKVRHLNSLSRFALVAGLLQSSDSGGNTGGNTGSSSSSSSSSGGGGGGGTSGENYSNIEVKERKELDIFKDITIKYIFTDQRNPIAFVNITGNVNAGEISATVEVLKNLSSLLKIPAPGIIYKNINIWLGSSGFATSKNIKSATLSFRIENSWLDKNSMRDHIKLARWNNKEWEIYKTSKMKKDYNYTYFESQVNGFSNFAITGLKDQEDISSDVVTNKNLPPQDTDKSPKVKQTATKVPNSKAGGFEFIIAIISFGLIYIWRKR